MSIKFFSRSLSPKMSIPFLATALAVVPAVNAEELYHEQHAHVHGAAQFTLVIDKSSVVIDLDSPAMNIVGFEHQPKNKEDENHINDAVNTLKNSRKVFAFPADADCKQVHSKVTSGLISAQSEVGLEQGHTAFEVGFQIECAHPENITNIQFPIFKLFTGLKKLHGQWVVGDQQGAGDFSLDNNRIEF